MTTIAVHASTGQLVTPEEFIALEGADWRSRPPAALCPSCQEPVYPWGVHSHNVTSRFHHYESELRNCPLSSNPDGRFAHLVPAEWDPEGGERLREAVCSGDRLRETYVVAHALCLKRLSCDEFFAMCRAADKLNIWAYKDLPSWLVPWLLVPWLLVTLLDLPVVGKRTFQLRIVLEKPERSP